MNELRWYYLNDNNEVIGPVTVAGIKALRAGGEIAANTILRQEGTDSWIAYSHAFPSSPSARAAQPASPRQPTQSTSITSPKVGGHPKAANACAGCLGVIALFLLWIGLSLALETTRIETKYSKEAVTNPQRPYRDSFKIYSPDEERAYQQKVIDAHFKDTWTQTKVEKTGDERVLGIFLGALIVGGAIALAIAAFKVLKWGHS